MEKLDKKALAQNLITILQATYSQLREKNPDRDEHWFLANTWLIKYGSTEQANQKGAEWTKFVAFKDTCQFSILEPPNSIRALALFLVYKELGEQQATYYANEFSELMEPIIKSKESNVFLDKYKEGNPRTWRENQAEDNSRYSLYWFFKGLEFQQEHPEEAEEAWSNSESKRKIE